MNETKRSIKTSITALILCFIMLVGTTFAWFTDEVTSANNIIKTGNLDIGMLWSNDNSNWNDTEGALAKPIFSNDKWEPGYTEVRYIKVQNLGSLAFQYKMAINPTGAVGKLAEVIDVSYDIVTGNDNFVAPTAADKQGSLTKVATLKELILADGIVAGGVLLPESEIAEGYYSGEIVICISFHMQESAGNEYQDANIGGDFGINLYATQFDYESDSFDSSYDDEAEWPEMPINQSASADIDSSNLIHGALTSEVTINGNGISATIPEDVKVENGATSLQLTVKDAEADSNISYTDGGNAKGFDVHIAGIAADNTKPMIVNLGAVLPTGLSDTELKLYHTENGTPEEMTRVASASNFTLHNQYTYNAETGEVSIYVATFSVFSAVKTTASKLTAETVADTSWYDESKTEFVLQDAADFLGFRDLVDAGTTFAGKTVKLGVDIDLNNINFDPIGYGYTYNKDSDTAFMGTFDGQKHTIYNLYQNGWDLDPDKTNYSTYTYSTAGGGLFASIENATIKNLAVSGADIKFECVDIGIVVGYAQGTCHFENIVVTDSVIANYNRATGGVVGEVCYGPYGTDISEGYSHTFKNITVDSSVVVSSLWGSFDTLCGGVIGGKWGDATVKMEDVIVAAELDVYSDVTAAYQWYAYRRCGMLIGHTEQSSPKKSEMAKADFLTCENVNVYYGDWVQYTYYEFNNQKDSEGNSLWYSNYPWVREQAGKNNGAFSNARYGNPIVNGTAINTKALAELNKSDYVQINFDQLYGGGQGVYGTSKHDGVTTHTSLTKTIYFQDSWKWNNVYLYYWYEHEETIDGKTTVHAWENGAFPGVKMELVGDDGTYNIYKIEVPAYASGFVFNNGTDVNAANHIQSVDIMVADAVDGYIYSMVSDGNSTNKKDNVTSAKYVDGYKTIYFQNNWNWTTPQYNYFGVTLDMKYEKQEGTYKTYSFKLPNFVPEFKVLGSGEESIKVANSSVTSGKTYNMYYESNQKKLVESVKIYLKPNSNWKQSSAWFAARIWDNNGDAWFKMTADGNGYYYCYIPKGYTNVIFCRMNSSTSSTGSTGYIWDNVWNQTSDLTISGGKNCYTVSEGAWSKGSGSWSTKN